MKNPLDELSQPTYWSNRYTEGRNGWDQKQAHPQFLDLMDHHPDYFVGKEIAVIGAGPGHDAQLLASKARSVLALDFSSQAEKSFRQYYPDSKVDYRLLDFFNLPEGLIADIVVEHTLLCAINPNRHKDYFRSLRKLIKPNGLWIAIIWNQAPGGPQEPPFPVSNQQVQEGLGSDFQILKQEPVSRTFPGRVGETLWIARKEERH